MKTYIVRVAAIVQKEYEVQAKSEHDAEELAHEIFDLGCDGRPEKYSQDTVSVELMGD